MKIQVNKGERKELPGKLKVLFVGGTGIISSACAELAIERGVEIYLLTRGKSRRPIPKAAIWLQGDIRQPRAIPAILGDFTFSLLTAVSPICLISSTP